MNVLFIHQNFPGQFVHLSAHMAKGKRNRVVALTMCDNPAPERVQVRKYSLLRSPAQETHPMLRDEEAKVMRAEACAAAAFQLKREGFEPDLIVAHPGWGEALFIKDVFPRAKLVIYCEYYYAAEGQDVGFDPDEPPLSFQQRCRIRMKNTSNLLSLEAADAAVSPTSWQRSTYPTWAREKIQVIHDGIDLAQLAYNPRARLTLAANERHGGLTFVPGDEVVSFVARNLEPVRGFHILMRTLPAVLAKRPRAHVIIVGGDEISYGRAPNSGSCWRETLLTELRGSIDLTRVHFVGKIPFQSFLDLISITRVHLYWTTPFVLSWSFMQAAMAGIPVVASDTAPVNEFAELFGVRTHNFFATDEFAQSTVDELSRLRLDREPKFVPELSTEHCVLTQERLLLSL